MLQYVKEHGSHLFNIAVKKNFKNVIELLLKKGVDINKIEEGSESALVVAARSGDNDMIDYLMELGAKLVVDEDNYCRAMYLAVANGHLHTVKHLESLGVSLHFSKEKSLVMKSLSNNHEDIFYYANLLKNQ